MQLNEILAKGENYGASDIHITPGQKVAFRIDGSLFNDNELRPSMENIIQLLRELEEKTGIELTDPVKKEVDFSFSFGESRVRGNLYFSDKLPILALRLIPKKIRTLDDLGYPPLFKEFCSPDKGLVLVAGPTGSGKSTTLAAMLEHINVNRPVHLITIEDPIEYVFESKLALVHQRELGQDTSSFSNGLKYALRQDPDVIHHPGKDYWCVSAISAESDCHAARKQFTGGNISEAFKTQKWERQGADSRDYGCESGDKKPDKGEKVSSNRIHDASRWKIWYGNL